MGLISRVSSRTYRLSLHLFQTFCFANMDPQQADVCTWAALLLHDNGNEISEENINNILDAANINFVDRWWPGLFAKALQDVDVTQLITTVSANAGTGGGGATAGAGAAAADGDDGSDSSMGFGSGGLFDF